MHPALEGDQRPPAGARAVGDLHDIARAVADEGHGLSVEAGEDQLPPPARPHRAVLLVQHLGIAVVLVHMREARTRVAFEAPGGDLREPGQVVGLGPKGRLDPGLGRRNRGARLARMPRDADPGVLGQVDSLLRRVLGEEEGVGRRAAEHRDRIRQERIDALVGRQPAHREHEAAQVLRRIEAAPVAYPRPVGEGRHHHVGLPDAIGVERARVGVIEAVPVLARVEERERAPRRRRGQVHSQNFGQRDREHVAPGRPGRLVLLQLILGGEGQTSEVVEGPDARGGDARGPELAAVERAVGRGMAHLRAQALGLPARHRGARSPLDLGLKVAGGHQGCRCASVCSIAAPRVEEDPWRVKASRRSGQITCQRHSRQGDRSPSESSSALSPADGAPHRARDGTMTKRKRASGRA